MILFLFLWFSDIDHVQIFHTWKFVRFHVLVRKNMGMVSFRRQWKHRIRVAVASYRDSDCPKRSGPVRRWCCKYWFPWRQLRGFGSNRSAAAPRSTSDRNILRGQTRLGAKCFISHHLHGGPGPGSAQRLFLLCDSFRQRRCGWEPPTGRPVLEPQLWLAGTDSSS